MDDQCIKKCPEKVVETATNGALVALLKTIKFVNESNLCVTCTNTSQFVDGLLCLESALNCSASQLGVLKEDTLLQQYNECQP